MSAPLERALRDLLCLDDSEPLPCPATQAALKRAWAACAHPKQIYFALWACGDESAAWRALEAWRAAAGAWLASGAPLSARWAGAFADAIRAAVPCPVLPREVRS